MYIYNIYIYIDMYTMYTCIYMSPIPVTKLSSPKPTNGCWFSQDATYAAFKSFVSQLIADASKEVGNLQEPVSISWVQHEEDD